MSAPVIERLAEKLAAADLDDEETALLAALLAGSDEGEVSGFSTKTSAPFAVAPRSPASWIDVLSVRSSVVAVERIAIIAETGGE